MKYELKGIDLIGVAFEVDGMNQTAMSQSFNPICDEWTNMSGQTYIAIHRCHLIYSFDETTDA